MNSNRLIIKGFYMYVYVCMYMYIYIYVCVYVLRVYMICIYRYILWCSLLFLFTCLFIKGLPAENILFGLAI